MSTTWQDIETAPTNEYVLVFCPDAEEGSRILICARLVFEGDPEPPDWYELNCDTRPEPIDADATHWMPLPSPPSVER